MHLARVQSRSRSVHPSLGDRSHRLLVAGAVHATLCLAALLPAQTNWQQLAPATQPIPRSGYGIAYDSARDRVVMFGGNNAVGTPFIDVWEWDGVDWTERPAPAVSASSRRGLVYDSARGRIVLVDLHLWDWDGVTWIDRGPATAPPRGDARSARVWANPPIAQMVE